jgi:hypothetical protein
MAMDLKSSLDGLQSFLAAIHNIRPLGLQLFCVVAAIFLSIFVVRWRSAVCQARALANENVSLEVKLAIARTSLEYEGKLRVALEAADGRTVSSSSALESKPSRELQELLAKESLLSTMQDYPGKLKQN